MKPVWNFIIMLLITWLVLALYSFSDVKLKIGNIEIKKSGIKEFILGDTTRELAKIAYTEPYHKRKIDSSKQKILLIGDSMLEQLRWKMRDYCDYNGHELYVVIWYSAQSKWYGESDTLKYFINKIKPTYIFLVLGANELFVRNIKTRRAKYIISILNQIGNIPYVWIGPPNWKKDTGINDLILRFVGSDHFFPSYKVSLNNPRFTRYKDGAHPKPQAAQIWMDSIAVWVMKYSAHPILMNKPDKPGTSNINKRTYILQPLK